VRRAGLRVFVGDLLQRGDVERLVGNDLLELAFSRSSSLSRLASLAFMPPYWLRPGVEVFSEIIERLRRLGGRLAFAASGRPRAPCA
jgi:hypothetical protein